MTITTIDRNAARKISEVIENAARKALADLGLTMTPPKARFGATNCAISFEVATVGTGGVALTREAALLAKYASQIGLPSDIVGKRVVMSDGVMTITGANSRSDKFPLWGVKEKDGKTYKVGIQGVWRALGVTEVKETYSDKKVPIHLTEVSGLCVSERLPFAPPSRK